jgi:hypothetical protein
MKTHEAPKTNGSIRLSHNTAVGKRSSSPGAQRLPESNANKNLKQQASIIDVDKKDEKVIEDSKNILDEHRRKHLAKMKDDDFKFIDTSFESDLPPTLSQLQNAPIAASSPSSLTPTTLTTAETIAATIISSENEIGQLNSINNQVHASNVGNNVNARKGSSCVDLGVDSAVEDSTVSLEQVLTFIVYK